MGVEVVVEEVELELEEDLFAKLIFLYRSPETEEVMVVVVEVEVVVEEEVEVELELEEDLFAKLIFLYRSPETVIKWTREKNND
ncbi:unnamed protein product [Lampetra fluviatilis]